MRPVQSFLGGSFCFRSESRQKHNDAHHLRGTAASGECATCGDYLQGIARIRCTNPECGHDYFRPFSCKGFYLCPSCGQKRTLLFGEHLTNEVLLNLPHRRNGNRPSDLRRHAAGWAPPAGRPHGILISMPSFWRVDSTMTVPFSTPRSPASSRWSNCSDGVSSNSSSTAGSSTSSSHGICSPGET